MELKRTKKVDCAIWVDIEMILRSFWEVVERMEIEIE